MTTPDDEARWARWRRVTDAMDPCQCKFCKGDCHNRLFGQRSLDTHICFSCRVKMHLQHLDND